MHKHLIAALMLATFGASGAAFADDDDCRVPMADWQPREAVRTMAEAQGWTVRRIKIDDGCYEIDGADAEGRGIEVKLDPGTLAVIDMEYDDDDGPDLAPAPAGSVPPPANGLITPGTAPVIK